ncbi:Leucine-rich repeat protein kinase family protein isoform 2 [Hibiscus syriacus]|uniref:Leucine-rich repeat protein kinase family protein isoform 2 n=1 Tax=Hibiscus syriacus TaxID=106335 RepID=A0A6A2XQ79_HIBSY|nr:Leucine-rich repeat protein kinase family protein isoform 2 [Hibiscus syriacus]
MPKTKLKSLLHLFVLFWVFLTCFSRPITYPPQTNLLFPFDAVSILSFKSKADLDNKLLYALNERFDYCQWRGVKCAQGRVVRYTLQNSGLRGVFPANSLSLLDQLRVLSLHNNSLSGPVPDLSSLYNLKSLFLDRNNFSGTFPPSILFLHRITTLDLSHNGLTGPIPANLTALERLNILRLEWNRFNGSVPPLNQSFLLTFNVSGNNLTGKIPVTPTLSKFNSTAFSLNPDLCGEIINKACSTSRAPFFGSPSASGPLGRRAETQSGGAVVLQSPSSPKKHRRTGMKTKSTLTRNKADNGSFIEVTNSNPGNSSARVEEASQRKIVIPEIQKLKKSGSLVFVGGEVEGYSLEQLMRASAELLGRGTMGTTYKAVVDRQLILTVKRLDASKSAATTGEDFEQHMDAVGELIHPNLVPLRAYFQAKGERLVIYDYQPNGSVFNLVHGPGLHPPSVEACPWQLKSTNVLLGADFEACLTDYCLAVLADSPTEDPDFAAYKAPRTTREDDVGENHRLGMLTEVASVCSLTSPEQRPAMWQV